MPSFFMFVMLSLAVSMALPVPVDAARLIVAYNHLGDKTPAWKTRNYGVDIRYFDNDSLAAFASALPQAEMLVFSGNSAYYDAEKMIVEPKCRQAIATFLKNGGTIFFNFNGFCFDRGCAMRRFLETVGVNAPGIHWDGYASICAAPGCRSPLTERLATLKSSSSAAYGYFTDVAPSMTVALIQQGRPDRPVLLVQDKVSGAGRVIFSRVAALADAAFQTEPSRCPLSSTLFENLLVFAFGDLGKGAPAALADKAPPSAFADPATGNWTQLPVTGMNPYYLRDMIKKPWWRKDWTLRLPILVREPMGAFREAMTVCVRQAFPINTAASSFRVVTPEWREIPSMARLVDKATNVHEITFSDTFLCYELKGYFIYSDAAAKAGPSYESSVVKSDARRTKNQERLIEMEKPESGKRCLPVKRDKDAFVFQIELDVAEDAEVSWFTSPTTNGVEHASIERLKLSRVSGLPGGAVAQADGARRRAGWRELLASAAFEKIACVGALRTLKLNTSETEAEG